METLKYKFNNTDYLYTNPNYEVYRGIPLFRHFENRRPKQNDLQNEFPGELQPLVLTIQIVNA